MIGRFTATWKRLDYYRKAALLSLPISLIFLILLGYFGEIDLLFSQWYLDFIPIPAFIGTQLSCNTYLGRKLDLDLEHGPSAKNFEKWATGLGICLGLAIGISISILSPVSGAFFDGIQAIVFSMTCISVMAGLGNRIGATFGKSERPAHEKITMGIGGLLGLAFSIALLATAGAAAVSVVGLSTVLTGGAALPLWIAGGIFVMQTTSLFASASDYSAKAFTFIRSKVTDEAHTKNIVKERFYEHRGAFYGTSAGVAIGLIIIIGLAIAQPHLLAGLMGLALATMIILSAVSVIGGLTTRICKMGDGIIKANKEHEGPEKCTKQSLKQFQQAPSPPSFDGLKKGPPKPFAPAVNESQNFDETQKRDRLSVRALLNMRAPRGCPPKPCAKNDDDKKASVFLAIRA